MSDDPKLMPASADDVRQVLSYSLRFNGRRHWHNADQLMAQLTANHLLDHLTRCGFVLMRKPPASPLQAPMSDRTALKD